jgi:hypothetical protein
VEDGGGVFRRVRERATAQRQAAAVSGHQYSFGVDWGRSNDFTVIAVWDITLRALVAFDRFNMIDYALQLGRLRAMYDTFRPSTIIAEYNSMGGPLVEALQGMNLPVQAFTTTNASKAMIIDALALGLEKGDVTLVNDPVLLAEMQAYESERLPGGLLRYGAPEGMHDDMVMAAALGWQAAATHIDGAWFV